MNLGVRWSILGAVALHFYFVQTVQRTQPRVLHLKYRAKILSKKVTHVLGWYECM